MYRIKWGMHNGKTLDELSPEYLNNLMLSDWFKDKRKLEEYIRLNEIDIKCPVGKYRGKWIWDIKYYDSDFIKWLIDKNYIHPCFV